MTSSSSASSSSVSEEEILQPRQALVHHRTRQAAPPMLKEELRLSIIARRHARGEKQIKIEYPEPKVMELSPSELEKKERRREQNRRAAQRCRSKKRMNQYSVIQNFEKVMEQNQDLRQEVEALKRERDGLQKTLHGHRLSCTCNTKVKLEPDDVIKMETEDLKSTPDTSSCQSLGLSHSPVGERMSVVNAPLMSSLNAFPIGGSPSISNTAPNTSEIFPANDQLSIQVAPSQSHQFQPQLSSTTVQHHQHPWRYSPYQGQHHNSSCMFQTCTPKIPRLSQLEEQLHQTCETQRNPQQQDRIFDMDHPQDCFLLNPTQNSVGTAVANNPTTSMSTSRNSQYPDLVRLLQSQPSPCQVVPSMNSPNSFMNSPAGGCPETRRRSYSGESASASDNSRPGTEVRFSSVSSESSMYNDTQSNISEVPDIPDDTEDVFNSSALGHDVNNNAVRGQDLISSENWRDSDLGFPDDRIGEFGARSGNLAIDDVSNLLMQIPSGDLFFFEDSEPSSEILTEYIRFSSGD